MQLQFSSLNFSVLLCVRFTKSYFDLQIQYFSHAIILSNNFAIRNAFEPRTAITTDPFHCLDLDSPKHLEYITMFKITQCKEEIQEQVF